MFQWLINRLTKRLGGGMFLLRSLAGGLPGAWTSDHRKESEFFNHWNGVAIHQICLQLMQADVVVYQDTSPGARRKRRLKAYATQGESQELPETDPLVKLMKRPNPWESGGVFRYRRGQQLELTGVSMVWNVPTIASRNAERRKVNMRLVIPTALATPVAPSRELPFGGWRVQPPNGMGWNCGADSQGFVEMFGGIFRAYGNTIPHEQMQISRWPHPLLPEDGCSPTGRISRWNDGDAQVGIAQWSQLKNGADPSLFVEVSADVDWNPEIAKTYAEKFAEKYGGPQNVGRVMMTQGKATPISTTPKDMCYTEAHNMYRDAIFEAYGLPRFDSTSYASLYAGIMQFVTMTCQPIASLFAEDDTEHLAPAYGEGLTIEMECKQVNDPEVLDREIQTDASAKAITVNEIRSLRGRPPISGGESLAGPTQPATGLNVSGGISLGGMGLNLPTETTTGQAGAPAMQLETSNSAAELPTRLSLNGVGKHLANGNGRRYP